MARSPQSGAEVPPTNCGAQNCRSASRCPITALIKTQAGSTKLVVRVQPLYEGR